MKIPVVNKKDYTMYLEMYGGMLWFHTDVRKWSSEVKTKYLEDLNLLHYLTNVPLVAMVEEDDRKLAKFATLIGFNSMNTINLNNGKVGLVYARSL